MLPNLVIIGAQKSATSFVQANLAAHPDAFLVRREIAFFEDPGFDAARVAELERLLPRGVPRPRVFGIKRPDYLARPEVPGRLADHLPGARLVAVLREPIERAVSAYHHYVRYRFLPDLPLGEGLTRILDRPPADGAFSPESAVLEYGRYATCVRRYLDHFPAESIRVLLNEEVLADPPAAFADLLRFLDLPASTRGFPVERSANPGVYSPARLAWLRGVQRLVCEVDPPNNRWRIRFGPLGLGCYFLARQVDKRLLAPFCTARPAPLEPRLRERLAEYYAAETDDLERLLGRSLPAWREAAR